MTHTSVTRPPHSTNSLEVKQSCLEESHPCSIVFDASAWAFSASISLAWCDIGTRYDWSGRGAMLLRPKCYLRRMEIGRLKLPFDWFEGPSFVDVQPQDLFLALVPLIRGNRRRH